MESLCTLYLHACLVRVTISDSGLCCCTCVTHFEYSYAKYSGMVKMPKDKSKSLVLSYIFALLKLRDMHDTLIQKIFIKKKKEGMGQIKTKQTNKKGGGGQNKLLENRHVKRKEKQCQ